MFNSLYRMHIEHISLGFADLTEIFLNRLDEPPKELSSKEPSPKKTRKSTNIQSNVIKEEMQRRPRIENVSYWNTFTCCILYGL